MNNILTYDKILEAQKLLKTPETCKIEFFDKYFPMVEDCSDWVVIFPNDEKITDDILEEYPWIKQAEYAHKIIAFNPKTAYDDILK